jgi:hypothetical protein
VAADLEPFAIYHPASISVGMYQMTDAAFAEARHYCIRDHVVVEDSCALLGLDSRVLPNRAIELAAVFLDRKVAAILARRGNTAASEQQKRELAAIIHLCGAGSAKAFARRGFHPASGERCGRSGGRDISCPNQRYEAETSAARRRKVMQRLV